MYRLLSTIDYSMKAPAVDNDILFVNDRQTGDPVLIPCADIDDVYLLLPGQPPDCSRIVLRNGETIIADNDPDMVRELWLAWAEDNLRFTTEVRHAK